MYGLVNRAIKEHVVAAAGEAAWNAVRNAAELEDDFFVAMDAYDDDITYRLVAAASEVLKTPADEILAGFGRYWILYTGAEGWGPVLDMQGNSMVELLGNLNAMHLRLRTTMPKLRMPEFHMHRHADDLVEVEYHSEREGFAPMVLGLLGGLAERFDEEWTISQVGWRSDDGFDTFRLVGGARPSVGDAETRTAS